MNISKNILYLEAASGRGGSTLSLSRLLAFIPSPFRPVIVLERKKADAVMFKDLNVEVIHAPRPFDELFDSLSSARPPVSYLIHLCELIFSILPHSIRLLLFIKRRNIIIVHLNNHIGAQLSGILAAFAAKVPCVVHLRNLRRLTLTERFAACFVDQFLVLAEGVRHFYAVQGIPNDRINVLYDPIAKSGCTHNVEETRQLLGICSEGPCVGILSRVVEGKGHEIFLKAAALAAKRFPNARFVIAERERFSQRRKIKELKRQALELELEDKVIFSEWDKDFLELISIFDVIVDASVRPEGTRLVILQSMSMAKPVVATRVGGEAEFFDHNRRGILVDPGHADELGKAICLLLEDPSYAKRLGQEACEHVLHLCDPARSAESLGKLYERLTPLSFLEDTEETV
ncbi:MAG: glycosyltransferase family 4 protein [Candidatus Omnitrophica bacterium]|nr:glycosyltransferase family 4 protein [Candidatus Omnitrophota bacterium]